MRSRRHYAVVRRSTLVRWSGPVVELVIVTAGAGVDAIVCVLFDICYGTYSPGSCHLPGLLVFAWPSSPPWALETMTGVAFLSAVPPSWHPPAPRACVCGRRSSTVSGRAQSGWTVGGGAAWFFRRPVAPAVARRAGGRWRMGAGAGAGEVGGSEDGAEGGDPDLDLSALRRRMEELEQGGKQDNDDDEDGDEPVLEVVVEEVIFGDANGADDEVMVLDLRDDDDDGSVVGKRGDDGEPIMGELRPPNSSENKEIATAYRDCDSLYIILFNAAANGEGLYSIQVGGMNVVLAFARMEEAGRYALALREQKIIDVESIVDIQVAVRLSLASCTGLLTGYDALSSRLGCHRPCCLCSEYPNLVPFSLLFFVALAVSHSMPLPLRWHVLFCHRSWSLRSSRNFALTPACGSALSPPTRFCPPSTCTRRTTRRFPPFPRRLTHYAMGEWTRTWLTKCETSSISSSGKKTSSYTCAFASLVTFVLGVLAVWGWMSMCVAFSLWFPFASEPFT